MADNEGLRLETELEIKNVEVEIKEIEVEMYRNSYEIIKLKEEIDEENIPEDELKRNMEFILSDTSSGDVSLNYALIRTNSSKMGILTFKNLALEDEKFSLISYKEDLQEQLRKIEEGVKFK